MTVPVPVSVPWHDLRRHTTARVALGRAGNAMPTAAHLAFQAAHAAARDAVHAGLDVDALAASIAAPDIRSVRSACPDRTTYLLRPDLGRRLADEDRMALGAHPAPGRLVLAICDGLSATAVQRHAGAVLAHLLPRLDAAGPVVIATQGRVALGDDIGAALRAQAVAVLIGERPGLTTPDSLGIYLTWAPVPGRTDAERNCISNVHATGLAPVAAAEKLLWLVGAMRRMQVSGVGLKDEQPIALT
ncbi:MAG TPA: ethanolamine ammonia-lyase subunit EutC [Rhodopila sp.]|uniref:ethanolamine ammonia-lyase subunit EutC n=1 Tax=Rhodopila sp. TaxID=2480087 RepID=UPI002CA0F72A|nr:ethanolamine ammonia-lyase subunit EutC [Rhodopila sp.]HVY17614.1 ethanolamine ammonia-lyase subunit EutC [Rhodopila sp.]